MNRPAKSLPFPGLDLAIAAALGAATIAHSLPDLAINPPISFDEGYNLQAPWNLLQSGLYGTRTATGEVPFDPHVTTGPTVTLLVALAFAAFGDGVAQARIVSVVYGALAVCVFYALARGVGGRPVGIVAALVLSFSFYPHNRVVLGEAPGLFWLLTGIRLLVERNGRTRSRARLVLAGTAFGLAALTKVILAPMALAVVVASWVPVRRGPGRWAGLVIPALAAVLPLGLWYGIQAVLLGAGETWERIGALASYRGQVFDPVLERLVANLVALAGALPPALQPWVIPALTFAVANLAVPYRRRPEVRMLAALAVVGLLFYLVSAGWPRYAFWAAAGLCGLLAVLVDLLHRTGQPFGRARASLIGVMTAVVLVAPGAAATLAGADDHPDHSGNVVAFLRQWTASDDVLGTAEWEIDFLLQRPAVHPPFYAASTTAEEAGAGFDWSWPGVDWVVVGPIGDILGARERLSQAPAFTEVYESGPYTVFWRNTGPAPAWTWDTASVTRVPFARPRISRPDDRHCAGELRAAGCEDKPLRQP